MSDNLNQKAMIEILQKNQLLYPDERVISFLSAFYSDRLENTNRKALDIGFSSGRHLSLLVDYQFQSYGIDYNSQALEVAQHLFRGKINKENLKKADIADQPFPENYFDVVVFYGAAFLRPIEGMKSDLNKVCAMMKIGGKMIVNFRSTKNWFYGKGSTQDGRTYVLNESAGGYANITYTFLDRTEAEELLNETGFIVRNYELFEISKKNATEQHSWHVFWAEKL